MHNPSFEIQALRVQCPPTVSPTWRLETRLWPIPLVFLLLICPTDHALYFTGPRLAEAWDIVHIDPLFCLIMCGLEVRFMKLHRARCVVLTAVPGFTHIFQDLSHYKQSTTVNIILGFMCSSFQFFPFTEDHRTVNNEKTEQHKQMLLLLSLELSDKHCLSVPWELCHNVGCGKADTSQAGCIFLLIKTVL